MRSKTIGEVVAEVLMLSAAKRGHSFLVVEGTDDWKFWTVRVHRACEVVNATGKSTGVGAVRRLNGRNFVGHLGIFDRDYADALAKSNWRANEVYWDSHSLETALFLSKAFDKVVAEHVDRNGQRTLEAQLGKSIREYVQEAATTIGSVRYVLYLSGNVGDGDVLSPFRHTQAAPAVFDFESILAAGVTLGAAPSVAQLRVSIRDHATLDARLLMRGHDLSAIISIVVGCCGGACSNKRAEEVLRVGFETGDLEATSVFEEIRAWEQARAPRRILE